jgi:hypothetical protein
LGFDYTYISLWEILRSGEIKNGYEDGYDQKRDPDKRF